MYSRALWFTSRQIASLDQNRDEVAAARRGLTLKSKRKLFFSLIAAGLMETTHFQDFDFPRSTTFVSLSAPSGHFTVAKSRVCMNLHAFDISEKCMR